jgi:hypothetical protein
MAGKFKKDDVVNVNGTIIDGTVVSRAIIEDEDHYLVAWVDDNGLDQQRYFHEDQISA